MPVWPPVTNVDTKEDDRSTIAHHDVADLVPIDDP